MKGAKNNLSFDRIEESQLLSTIKETITCSICKDILNEGVQCK